MKGQQPDVRLRSRRSTAVAGARGKRSDVGGSLAVFSVVLVCSGLAGVGGCRQQTSKEQVLKGMPEETRRLLGPMQSTPMMVDGIDQPRFVSADQAEVADGVQVIGVIVGDQPRAYPLPRLSGMMQHVVNDHARDASGAPRPFTVTYCDQTDCIRVFAAAEETAAESLGMGTLGMIDGGLALRWQDQHFKQADEVSGLRDLPFERTRWDRWKQRHPDTTVYVAPQP